MDLKAISSVIGPINKSNITNQFANSTVTASESLNICEYFDGLSQLELHDHGITVVTKLF